MGSLWPDKVLVVPVSLLDLEADALYALELFGREIDNEAAV